MFELATRFVCGLGLSVTHLKQQAQWWENLERPDSLPPPPPPPHWHATPARRWRQRSTWALAFGAKSPVSISSSFCKGNPTHTQSQSKGESVELRKWPSFQLRAFLFGGRCKSRVNKTRSGLLFGFGSGIRSFARVLHSVYKMRNDHTNIGKVNKPVQRLVYVIGAALCCCNRNILMFGKL